LLDNLEGVWIGENWAI